MLTHCTFCVSGVKDDLVVDYLDGDDAGVVVFGLNRPEVSVDSTLRFFYKKVFIRMLRLKIKNLLKFDII